ncbi:MAG: FtsH protease activity modulator HflK [Deltaproteobacteria bacterium]|nr:FtsH protease activity modulator HflK [Deltaproteobacteria bacterium]MBW1818254.1 FtsH protease activity modulator HflK [Deltaproteobacteria bacterium]
MAWDWDKLQQQKKGPSGGGSGAPPGMDEILERIKGLKGKFPGGAWIVVALVALFFIGASCLYTVAVDEVGVVQRFGKFTRTTSPGLNFKLPRGIETVRKVKVRFVFKEEFGFRTLEAGVRTRYASSSAYRSEALMLTGDLNVAVVPWIVQYRINDPFKFLFKVHNVRSTLRDLSESSMRLVVGDRSINEVISKREEIASAAKEALQKELDEAETGIRVSTIEMKRTNVPEPVQPSFNEVNQATQEKEKVIYQAREQYNKIIPAARGQAEKTIKAAEGYALGRVNRAKGDAARFLDLFEEYSKATDVTRRRLYLETMHDIFPKLGKKYIVDSEQKNLLPLLNLGTAGGGK